MARRVKRAFKAKAITAAGIGRFGSIEPAWIRSAHCYQFRLRIQKVGSQLAFERLVFQRYTSPGSLCLLGGTAVLHRREICEDPVRTSYLVCYDICDDKCLRKVFQAMRGY